MKDDPIVAEVRKHRQEIFAEYGYDLRAMAEGLQKKWKNSGHPIVDLAAQFKRREAAKARKSGAKKGRSK